MKYLAVVCGVAVLGISASALAETSGAELIVRYQQPQNTIHQAIRTALSSMSATAETRILNSSEGVVKLHFANSAAAETARQELEKSSNVLSVTPNFLYRPALHLQAKQAAEPLKTLLAPLADAFLSAVQIPAVQLPSGYVADGTDPLAASDWALSSIRMPAQAPAAEYRSPVIAAVIDTGVDYNHEDLIGAMWRNPDNAQEVGYDFVHNRAPYDVVNFDINGCINDSDCKNGINQEKFLSNPGHGTHCAGHIAAVANNSLGIRGIGAGSPLIGLKFFYDPGEANAGAGDDAAAIQAIDYAIEHGAKVISASWGGREKRADGESSELKNALIRAQKAGVLVVIAAGNDSINQDTDEQPSYPAAYNLDNLIIVAAVDSNDQLASFSNYGASSVQIAAPGVKILSTTVGSHYSDVVATFTNSQGQKGEMDWDGTSMATPIVAGAVAAVWTAHPSENYQQIRNRILNSARQVPGLAGKVSTGGVLNVTGALTM